MKTKIQIKSIIALNLAFALFLVLGFRQVNAQKIPIQNPNPPFRTLDLETRKMSPVVKPEASQLFIGNWIPTYSQDRDTVFLKKDTRDQFRWGNYMEFTQDGGFSKGYSAPCGNDTNIHRDEGSWKMKGSNKILFVSLPEQKVNIGYRVEKAEDGRIMLVEL